MKFTLITHSPGETKKIGKTFARYLKSGDVVALEGRLGAGKTTLVKGIAKGLGVKNERTVSSPTFVLMHEYSGREKIRHLDWYRLSRVEGVDAEMAEECFYSGAVTLVEWPQKGRTLLPSPALRIQISHRGGDKRSLRFWLPAGTAGAFREALKS